MCSSEVRTPDGRSDRPTPGKAQRRSQALVDHEVVDRRDALVPAIDALLEPGEARDRVEAGTAYARWRGVDHIPGRMPVEVGVEVLPGVPRGVVHLRSILPAAGVVAGEERRGQEPSRGKPLARPVNLGN